MRTGPTCRSPACSWTCCGGWSTLSAGVAGTGEDAVLPPVETLDGFGALSAAAAGRDGADRQGARAARGLAPASAGHLRAAKRTARAQPGRGAPGAGAASLLVPGAARETLTGDPQGTGAGPALLSAAVALLALDLLISLRLRGLLRLAPAAAGGLLLLAWCCAGAGRGGLPALSTRLAYVQTGDATVDAISQRRAGRAVQLREPAHRRHARRPGGDHARAGRPQLLSAALLADHGRRRARAPEAIAALNEFTSKGGIILIDTRDGGTGEGFAPGTEAALRRVSVGLHVPPLAPLTSDHVLARAFYLLQEFPGRFAGDTVWVQRDQDRANDSVSPVIIGGHDWAAAWAVDASGRNPYATHPRRRAAADAGLPVRGEPRDVRADRELQRRPGARAGDPGAAGAVRLRRILPLPPGEGSGEGWPAGPRPRPGGTTLTLTLSRGEREPGRSRR